MPTTELEFALEDESTTAISLAERFGEPDLRALFEHRQRVYAVREAEEEELLRKIAEANAAVDEIGATATDDDERAQARRERARGERRRRERDLDDARRAKGKLDRVLLLLSHALLQHRKRVAAGEATAAQETAKAEAARFDAAYRAWLESEGRMLAEAARDAWVAATRASDEARLHGASGPTGRDWFDEFAVTRSPLRVTQALTSASEFWPREAERHVPINVYANTDRPVVLPGTAGADREQRLRRLGMII